MAAVHGAPVPEVHGRTSVGWVRMATDLPTAAREILSRRTTLGEYVRLLGLPLEHAMFVADDPLPGVLDAPYLAALRAQRFVGSMLARVRR